MSRNIRHIRTTAVLCITAVLLAGAARAADAPADAKARRQREAKLIQTLKGSASRAEKDKACRELQVIGTPACIDALAALLADKDLSHMARCALEPMPYPQAARALRDALGKTSGTTKVGVIISLGFREDKQAAAELIKLLTDRDAAVAGAAAAALGRIGTPEAAKALDKFRAGAPGAPGLQRIAAEASLTAAERLLRQGRQAEAAAIYEDLQAGKWPAHVRLGAFVGLLAAGGDEAVSRAVAAIAGDDAAIRTVAIANIAALKGAGVGRRLAAELPKLPADAQVLLIGALGARGDAAVRPAIVKAAAGNSAEVRMAALKALGTVGDAGCVEVLCKAVAEGKSEAEKQAAVTSLEGLRGDKVNAALLACMKAAPPAARAKLINVLALRKAAGAVPDLVKEAKAPDAGVRAAALKALGWLAGPRDLPVLLGLLVKPTGETATTDAERAVVHVSRKITEEPKRADAVLAALKTATAAPVRCSLLRVLGGIGNAKALEAVRRAAEPKQAAPLAKTARDDESPSVRAAAVTGIGRMRAYEEMETVLAAMDDPDLMVRRRAADAVAHIIGRRHRYNATDSPEKRRASIAVIRGVWAKEKLALRDKDTQVRDAAVRALADWPDALALDALLGVFRTTDNRTHRVLALRGCVRLLGLDDRPAQERLKTYGELMKSAKRPEDKKLVLAGLANVADPAALRAVEPFLADAQVGAEAELAMLGIARGIVSSAGAEAKAAARKLAKSKSKAVRLQAAKIIRQVNALPAWTPLFNGKDLTGWRKTGSAIFTVADGCLVGTQTTGKGGDLWTEAEFDDFELRVTYRMVWPANSGFWFRHDGKRGYQYDVLKYKRPVAFSGTLYCPGKMFITKNLKESLENRDGWNEARLQAVGDELTLWLNGTQTGHCRDKTLRKGKIGIQVHGGNGFKGMKIIIRKMEIRTLKVQGSGQR